MPVAGLMRGLKKKWDRDDRGDFNFRLCMQESAGELGGKNCLYYYYT
jgi:hypothetical protein